MTTTIKICNNKGWLDLAVETQGSSPAATFPLDDNSLMENFIMKSKSCFKCNTKKPLTDFYKHPMMADGHVNKCKECNKKDVRQNYQDNHDHFQKYERSRAHLPHRIKARGYAGKIGNYCIIPSSHQAHSGRKADAKFCFIPSSHQSARSNPNAYRLRNPKKARATGKVHYAIKSGKLIRQPCEVCSTTENIHAHHCDYDKPLDVMWLCQKHHSDWHKNHGEII